VEDLSVLGMLGRLLVSLVVVFGLMALAARAVRRRGLTGGGTSATTRIEVLARQGLGRTSSVQLVRVAGRTLVLGVTEHTVQVLGDADPLLLAAEQALVPALTEARPTPGWGPLLEALKERTARRT
jgi:flagellar protein FliO/FliZ